MLEVWYDNVQRRRDRTMNVADLKSMLDEYADDTEVMIAHQPSWPLAETVSSVVALDVDEDDRDFDDCIWIVAGGHAYDRSPYAPRAVFDAGW